MTANFTLSELTRSSTARENDFFEQYAPSKKIIENLRLLCENVLQPIRDFLGLPVFVTSGYRCERLNKEIGGAENSHHIFGMAADFRCENLEHAFEYIRSALKFTQLIRYYSDGLEFLHVSYDENDLRCDVKECYLENEGGVSSRHYREYVK